ncbi:MAG: hypothetical protein IIX15_04720 [Clostridia bacterium]|nr:hypothetical protein [Clostridia bacterium]
MSLEDIITAVEQDSTLSAETLPPRDEAEVDATAEQEKADMGGLGALLSQPELMSKLPALLRIVQTMTEPVSKGACSKPDTPVALLTALRPYLNDHRRQALDTMIRISRLSESLRSLH